MDRLVVACLSKSMNSLGFMQGRLTRQNGRSIQFFPFDNWQNEFKDSVGLGFDEIEFIFDLENFESNPLWTDAGVKEINSLISKYGVKVNTICADYFMARPFFRTTEKICNDNISVLKKIIAHAHIIGAKRVEIPFLDNSSIQTLEEEAVAINILRIASNFAKDKDIFINIETDLSPKKLKSFIEKFKDLPIWITYDSGNSSGLGYDCKEEIESYGKYISNVHIKDRKFGEGTVSLGTGDANFDDLFESLKKVGYKGSIILQAARGEDGREKETIKNQREFVVGYINKYLT